MESPLVQYLRTGTIAPLKKGEPKAQVEATLGKPDDWRGRITCFTWEAPPLADFRDSQGWSYGSLGVQFDDRGLHNGMTLDYSEVLRPIQFLPPFHGLPATPFSVRDLIEMMDTYQIMFEDTRGDRDWPFILTEGGVAVATLHGNVSPKARVIHLMPYAPKPYHPPRR
jgi:hypothetical protein